MQTFETKLVSITTGAGDLRELIAQELISYTARVSNPSNQSNKNTSAKLINYLIKNKHWSPLEMASMCIEITTSRGISPQILRHRSFSFQEFSQRYAEVTNFVIYPARRQDNKNRQNSVDDMSQQDKDWFFTEQKFIQQQCEDAYNSALARGIAKEQARFLLPLGTQTKLYMSGTIRSWVHYISLRAAHGTQKEHMEIAEGCKKIFNEQFPDVAKALGWDDAENSIDV